MIKAIRIIIITLCLLLCDTTIDAGGGHPRLKYPRKVPSININLPSKIGQPIEWTINHINQFNGWSLTGWSRGTIVAHKVQTKVDRYFVKNGKLKHTIRFGKNRYYVTKSWFKIGLISGEINASRKYRIDNARWAEFADWEKEMERRPVFGIFFVKEF